MLSDITQLKSKSCDTPASDVGALSPHGPSNYVFEVHCGETVYYVGENRSIGAPLDMYEGRGVVCSMRSGSGLEQAQSWETAIRQARLPLTTRPSTTETTSSSSAAAAAVTVTIHQTSESHLIILRLRLSSSRSVQNIGRRVVSIWHDRWQYLSRRSSQHPVCPNFLSGCLAMSSLVFRPSSCHLLVSILRPG